MNWWSRGRRMFRRQLIRNYDEMVWSRSKWLLDCRFCLKCGMRVWVCVHVLLLCCNVFLVHAWSMIIGHSVYLTRPANSLESIEWNGQSMYKHWEYYGHRSSPSQTTLCRPADGRRFLWSQAVHRRTLGTHLSTHRQRTSIGHLKGAIKWVRG